MARYMSPNWEEINRLRTPLNEGERQVLELLDRELDEGWEIYTQPPMNGLRPDFVAMHPERGICIIEVKDWDLETMRYRAERTNKGYQLRATNAQGVHFNQENPVLKLLDYEKRFRELYCPSLGALCQEKDGAFAVINSCLVDPKASGAKLRELFRPWLAQINEKARRYFKVCGGESLREGGLANLLPWAASRRKSDFMNEQIASELRRWLREADADREQRQPLPLDENQLRLVENATLSGFRRIKGPAGSGKSCIVAARAARLSAEDKRVLVINFNITMLHCLRDLAVRYLPEVAHIKDITFVHFHEWCRRLCFAAGNENEYNALIQDSNSHKGPGSDNPVFDTAVPKLAAQSLRELRQTGRGGPEYPLDFDAILVDEGQDFNLGWWSLLREALAPEGGEMLLAADQTQDLYERSQAWTETSLQGAGFRGKWVQLKRSYRLPPELVPLLNRLITEHIKDSTSLPPEPTAGKLDEVEPVHLRWVQTSPEQLDEVTVRELARVATLGEDETGPVWADLHLLAASHERGLACVELLKQKHIEVCHVFGTTPDETQPLKHGFWQGDTRLKASTIQSFKGWEARALVVQIGRAQNKRALKTLYTALTRLKRDIRGSYLTVVCAANSLEDYGKLWPDFSDDRKKNRKNFQVAGRNPISTGV